MRSGGWRLHAMNILVIITFACGFYSRGVIMRPGEWRLRETHILVIMAVMGGTGYILYEFVRMVSTFSIHNKSF